MSISTSQQILRKHYQSNLSIRLEYRAVNHGERTSGAASGARPAFIIPDYLLTRALAGARGRLYNVGTTKFACRPTETKFAIDLEINSPINRGDLKHYYLQQTLSGHLSRVDHSAPQPGSHSLFASQVD